MAMELQKKKKKKNVNVSSQIHICKLPKPRSVTVSYLLYNNNNKVDDSELLYVTYSVIDHTAFLQRHTRTVSQSVRN